MRRLVFSLLVVLCATRAAAEPVPIKTFAADPEFSQAHLSRDGNFVAYIKEIDGFPWLVILDLQNRRSTKFSPGSWVTGEHREIVWFKWISNTRIAYLTTIWDQSLITGMSALDRDGQRWTHFAGPDCDPRDPFPLLCREIVHGFPDEAQSVLVIAQRTEEGSDQLFPDVVRVSTLTGSRRTVAKNPGNVVYWAVDRSGVVRLGVTSDGSQHGAIYRETEKAEWRPLPNFQGEMEDLYPLGFDSSGTRLIVAASNAHRRTAVYFYDLEKGKLGALIAGHDEYDVVPEFGALGLGDVIETASDGSVLGVNFFGELPRTYWFDSGLAAIQEGVDRLMAKTVNRIVSHSDDGKRYIICAYSDRDPGTYYLLDLRSGKPEFLRLAKLAPGIPVDRMAPMRPIQYVSRDGLTIHGYLTMPLGRERNVPLVVLPHGGPTVRDYWGYHADVQFLASRGYGVLQINYRGSPGFGTDFYNRGRREIGRGMQNDIEDGTRWAVSQGFADPGRLAIVGASYGGYSALFALAHNPDLYRCGISLAGVTDWKELVTEQRGDEYRLAYVHWKEWVGDPRIDADFLASISPVYFAAKIRAPVYIMQGKDDRIVPPKQARRLVEAMQLASLTPKTLYFSNEGHGLAKESDRERFLSEMESFLGSNMR